MYCKKCGNEMDPNMKFCPICGNQNPNPFSEEPPKGPVPDLGEEKEQTTYTAPAYTPSYEEKETNGYAIASLVLGICAFFTNAVFMVPSILAVIFGIIGIVKARKIQKGMALSISGLILGVIALFLYIYFIVLATYLFTGIARELGPDLIQVMKSSMY